jgi:hypothetical protein
MANQALCAVMTLVSAMAQALVLLACTHIQADTVAMLKKINLWSHCATAATAAAVSVVLQLLLFNSESKTWPLCIPFQRLSTM